jgi:uncharacterized protein YbjT (DUF2867 family)
VRDPATVLVTGASGTVGSALVAELARAGVPVRAGARDPTRIVAGDNVQTVRLDLRDAASVEVSLVGVQRVFLLTPLEEDMVVAAERFLGQARVAGVSRVVRLSVFGAGDQPTMGLAGIHRHTERVLESCGIPWASLRPNAFMQNCVSYFAESIRRTGMFHAPQGDGRVSVVDVRDIAAAAAKLLTDSESPSRSYELTGPEALSNQEIAATLSTVLGRTITYVDCSPDDARGAMLDNGMSPWLVEILMELYALSASGGAARVSPDLGALLGRGPTPFRRFAEDHADAFR